MHEMPAPATAKETAVTIDVVICTYNHAAGLDRVLSALSAQRVGAGVSWSVLVVDNGSIDATPAVVEVHRSRGLVPGLRRVMESEQGLTPARRRGVRETGAPWIAFVDDDNLLEPGWLDAIAQAIRTNPQAGGIGGRVVLDWEESPPRPGHARINWLAHADTPISAALWSIGSECGAAASLSVSEWLVRRLPRTRTCSS